jgi:hypothetical protein
VKLALDGSELAMATRQPVRPPAKVLGTRGDDFSLAVMS